MFFQEEVFVGEEAAGGENGCRRSATSAAVFGLSDIFPSSFSLIHRDFSPSSMGLPYPLKLAFNSFEILSFNVFALIYFMRFFIS
ncbi:MAG: hypothetical protein QXJ19_05605 [Candidatus Bathyarchaeia archaeon]|nr:hypothetical protein [Candidatus Bathyarchaeota archaeon]